MEICSRLTVRCTIFEQEFLSENKFNVTHFITLWEIYFTRWSPVSITFTFVSLVTTLREFIWNVSLRYPWKMASVNVNPDRYGEILHLAVEVRKYRLNLFARVTKPCPSRCSSPSLFIAHEEITFSSIRHAKNFYRNTCFHRGWTFNLQVQRSLVFSITHFTVGTKNQRK